MISLKLKYAYGSRENFQMNNLINKIKMCIRSEFPLKFTSDLNTSRNTLNVYQTEVTDNLKVDIIQLSKILNSCLISIHNNCCSLSGQYDNKRLIVKIYLHIQP